MMQQKLSKHGAFDDVNKWYQYKSETVLQKRKKKYIFGYWDSALLSLAQAKRLKRITLYKIMIPAEIIVLDRLLIGRPFRGVLIQQGPILALYYLWYTNTE